MDAIGAIQAALRTCGREVSLQKGGQRFFFTACIQPKPSASRGGQEQARFGADSNRSMVYYGPVSDGGELVEEGDLLTAADGQYIVLACHDFFLRTEKVFRYAAVQKLTGGLSDESISYTQK